jgi:hypothetical protein
MDKVPLILLFALGAAAVYFGAQYIWGLYYSKPRRFRYGEETFVWVPEETQSRSFFRRHYEHGSFQYADGTPVTDHRLHRMLQTCWVEQNRSREDNHGGD